MRIVRSLPAIIAATLIAALPITSPAQVSIGIGIGVGGLFFPRGLGVGYDNIAELLRGNATIGLIVVEMTAETALPIVMTPDLTAGLFLLTVVMCIASSIAAVVQVVRIDPARVFRQ